MSAVADPRGSHAGGGSGSGAGAEPDGADSSSDSSAAGTNDGTPEMASDGPERIESPAPEIDLAAVTLARLRTSARAALADSKRRSGPGVTRSGSRRANPWSSNGFGGSGEAIQYSGPGPDGRDPATSASALGSVVDSFGWQHSLAVAAIKGRWATIVGTDVAAHVVPLSFDPVDHSAAREGAESSDAPSATSRRTPPPRSTSRGRTPGSGANAQPSPGRPPRPGGTLILQADSTAWATQTRLLLPRLADRLDAELGVGVVGRIVVQGPAAPSWRKGAWHVPGRGPRDTYG